jgi:hypothetical protein
MLPGPGETVNVASELYMVVSMHHTKNVVVWDTHVVVWNIPDKLEYQIMKQIGKLGYWEHNPIQ